MSKIIQIISGRSIRLVHIPFLQFTLKTIANFLYVIGFGKFDFKITPNRVVKLFSDTSYTQLNYEDLDLETYTSRNSRQLTEILADFKKRRPMHKKLILLELNEINFDAVSFYIAKGESPWLY